MQVKLNYGQDSLTKTVDDGTTIGDLLEDESVQAALGLSESVRALIDGVEVGNCYELPSGAVVLFETRANKKA